jgi:hypothetical protein
MMDIPIENRDILHGMGRLRVARTDGDIVEEAEAHWLITLCMVSGWSDRTECRINGSVRCGINSTENASCGKKCNIKRLPDSIGVSSVKEAASAFTGRADVFDMTLRVNGAKLVEGGRSRIKVHEVLPQSAFIEVSVHPPQPVRPFRMAGGRQMPKKGIA